MAQLLVTNGAQVVYDGVFPNSPSPLKHAVWSAVLFNCWRISPFRENGSTRHGDTEFGRSHPLSDALEMAPKKNELVMSQLLVNHGADVNDRPMRVQFNVWTRKSSLFCFWNTDDFDHAGRSKLRSVAYSSETLNSALASPGSV